MNIEKLTERLLKELPGHNAHKLMAAKTRKFNFLDGDVKDAAVLIALFNEEGSWKIPLIRRVEDGKIHGGQIALPGGRIEDGETGVKAAVREANEEKLDLKSIQKELELLGKSVAVDAMENIIKIHVHVENYDTAITYGKKLGKVSNIEIGNMDKQFFNMKTLYWTTHISTPSFSFLKSPFNYVFCLSANSGRR